MWYIFPASISLGYHIHNINKRGIKKLYCNGLIILYGVEFYILRLSSTILSIRDNWDIFSVISLEKKNVPLYLNSP